MFYWLRSVQTYDASDWNYMDELRSFVSGGIIDDAFINAVSGIVNHGCHDPPRPNGFRRVGWGGGEEGEFQESPLDIARARRFP
jgi:hypothetical protein